MPEVFVNGQEFVVMSASKQLNIQQGASSLSRFYAMHTYNLIGRNCLNLRRCETMRQIELGQSAPSLSLLAEKPLRAAHFFLHKPVLTWRD